MWIYLVQRAIVWETPDENFRQIEEALEAAKPEQNGLVVLAEMYSTGFSFDLPRVGEAEDGPSSEFLRHLAMKHRVCVVGSFPHQPKGGGKGLNRLLVYRSDGTLALYYDKIHPFSYGKEADFYRGGQRLPLFSHQGWTICPTVCYDLRFPELYRRATLEGGADMFMCVANWPSARRDHWNTLLRARAIENQATMVAVNRVGSDPLNEYAGDSAVIDARGRELLVLGDQVGVGQVHVERSELVEWRERFPALADATEDFTVVRGETVTQS